MAASDVYQYEGLTYWSPISVARMEMLLDLLSLVRGDRVLDIGCGRSELLIRLHERYEVSAVGVDRSSRALALAREAIDERVPDADITLSETAIDEFSANPGSFAFIASMGGPHIGAGFRDTLRALSEWLRPDGYLLVGEGFWLRPPHPDYLAATGLDPDEFADHASNLQAGAEVGLTALYTCVSNRDEWDEFEGRIHYNVERRAIARPDDPWFAAELRRRRTWYTAQQRWGRDTMGFGLYLFRA